MPLLVFIASSFGLIVVSALLGSAIESLAQHKGLRLGGVLNACFGSASELIIAFFALRAGMVSLVKASIIGSILSNLLLVIGLCMFFGGLRNGRQFFDKQRAIHAATLMVLSAIAIGVPAFYTPAVGVRGLDSLETLSEAVAAVMIGIYLISIYYELVWNMAGSPYPDPVRAPVARWNVRQALFVLVGSLAAISYFASRFVDAIDAVVMNLNLSPYFIGIIVVPIVGNVAEHHIALRTAWRNRMDLSLTLSIDSSMRIALWVAPLLVFLSVVLGQPMNLVFSMMEIAAIAAASAIATMVALDGESNWFEGCMLLAVYLLMGLAFYWSPLV